MTISTLAREASEFFTTDTRADGTVFVKTENEPKWLHELVMEAHGAFLPEDFRYRFIREAINALADADVEDEAEAEERGHEYADDVDVYTHDRLAWLASNLNRPAYCDEAMSEFGMEEMPEGGIVGLIGLGQYMEPREVFASVLSSLAAELASRQSA